MGLASGSYLLSRCVPSFAAEATTALERAGAARPNILFVIAEDASWLHWGAYGDKVARTPAFDRLASEGVLFTHAFCSEPTCSPSRAAILTGQDFWRLEDASVFAGTLKSKFPVYPLMLRKAGYHVGYRGKVWSPSAWREGGWKEYPGGKRAPNFRRFLSSVPKGKPFCYWVGSGDAHRPYSRELTLRGGKDPEEVSVPPFMPDRPEVRMDLLDYYAEIDRFDRLLGQLLGALRSTGQADNTIVVVTSDHGMPFARGKANLYDFGTRVPLAVRWPAKIKAGRVVADLVSLTALAPTFLAAAGVEPHPDMTGRSLLPILLSGKAGRVDPARKHVCFGKEIGLRAYYGPVLKGYPNRAIRTERFLYIENYDIDKMPGPNPVQGGPATNIMKVERDTDAAIARMYRLAYGKRPAEELYDCARDPWQMTNVASEPEFAETKAQLQTALREYLTRTRDPRALGNAEVFMMYRPMWTQGRKGKVRTFYLRRNEAGKVVLESK